MSYSNSLVVGCDVDVTVVSVTVVSVEVVVRVGVVSVTVVSVVVVGPAINNRQLYILVLHGVIVKHTTQTFNATTKY